MAINKENYPEFFLDYFEDRLSEADKAELFVFLDRHAALREEFEAFELLALEPDPTNFPNRDSLKRGTVTPSNYEWYFAAYAEGDLSREERDAVEHFALAYPEKGRELGMMQAAFLDPSDVVTFPEKKALRRPLIVRSLWYYMSAAAVVLLVAGLFFMRMPDTATTTIAVEMPADEVGEDPASMTEVPSSPRSPAQQLAEREDVSSAAVTNAMASASAAARSAPRDQTPESSGDPMTTRRHLFGLIYADLPSMQAIPVNQTALLPRHNLARQAGTIEYKTEFAYWSPDKMPDEYYTQYGHDMESQSQPGQTSLAHLAFSTLQRNLPVDFSKVEDHLYQGRIPLRELAGIGLTEFGVAATTALGIERDVDENGRTLAVRAGNLFEARRNRR
jgi:hypothetical protein